MTGLIVRFAIIIGIMFLIDWYAWQAIRTLFDKSKLLMSLYWLISLSLIAYMGAGIFSKGAVSAKSIGILLISVYTSKLFIIIFLLGEDVFRSLSYGVKKITASGEEVHLPQRRKFVSQLGLLVAGINLGSIIYGVTKGKYNYKVRRTVLEFSDLPAAFDGFTITQLSDIHSGSFSDPDEVMAGIQMANDQGSDVMLFTGDLVNNTADEMQPWISYFSKLKAPYGKFSSLGNHDYGDYHNWPSAQAKKDNLQALRDTHKQIGFQLLDNQSVRIEKDGQHINILGVENWGLPPFPQKGDLHKAAENIGENDFNVLLSHDPTHWTEKVIDYTKKIHLTLSGHTHGMQYGIEIPGWFKFSPVQFKYKNWAGLYHEKEQYLYVNRGFGYLGFHGRVGIWPEVTVITLRKKQMA